MKKISSKNNSLYRLELVSGNKLHKIFTICHNAFPYLILPVWFPLLPPPPPFPSPLPAPWGCRHRVLFVPAEKDPISTVKTLKNC
jgi:hypothetical protein